MQINKINRRAFFKNGLWSFCLVGLAAVAAFFSIKKRKSKLAEIVQHTACWKNPR
jgi:hypothetical protein